MATMVTLVTTVTMVLIYFADSKTHFFSNIQLTEFLEIILEEKK